MTNTILRKILKLLKKKVFVFSKLFIYNVDLKNYTVNNNANFCLKIAKGIEDIKPIITEKGEKWNKIYSKWFDEGNTCMMGLKNEELAGIMWIFQGDEATIEYNYKYKLTTEEAFLNDGYVLEKFRNQGIFKLIHYGIIEDSKKLGFTKLYSTILAKNKISIIANYKLGVKDVVAILYSFNIYWYKILHLKKLSTVKHISNYVNFIEKE